MKKTLIIPLLFFVLNLAAQEQPFKDEIDQFKQADSIAFPPNNAILFVGSSSIRFWNTLKNDFPDYTIINRGFGGSTLPDVIHYANQIILPYKPKQIVIYCGENDLVDNAVTAEMVAMRYRNLHTIIRQALPDASIIFISIKPSPSRKNILPKVFQANALIKTFLADASKSGFVDTYSLMLDKRGNAREDLFLNDRLHMNAKGYTIWKKAIEPHLLK